MGVCAIMTLYPENVHSLIAVAFMMQTNALQSHS